MKRFFLGLWDLTKRIATAVIVAIPQIVVGILAAFLGGYANKKGQTFAGEQA